MRSILAPWLLLGLAAPAFATDGVLEINQACAVGTGCFSGDTAGFPVTIDGTAGRSYRLTSDLTILNENTDAIFVSTDDIGIDLNNFAIRGPVTCSGSPLTCTPVSAFRYGILSSGRGTSVKNGSITGMGACGVQLSLQAAVTGLQVRWNGGGICAQNGSIISGNRVYQNKAWGIQALPGSIVSGNTVYENGIFYGISGAAGSIVSGNASYSNEGSGIIAELGSIVSNNTAYLNWSGIDDSGNFGGLSVQRNTVRDNLAYGVTLGTQSTYRENTITNNSVGPVLGGYNIGDNHCSGTGTVSSSCP